MNFKGKLIFSISTAMLMIIASVVNFQDFVFGTTKGNRILETILSTGVFIAWLILSFVFGKFQSKKYFFFLVFYCGVSLLLTILTFIISNVNMTNWNIITSIIPIITIFLPMHGIIKGAVVLFSWNALLLPLTFTILNLLSFIVGRIIKNRGEL